MLPRENLNLKSSEMARNGSKTAKGEVTRCRQAEHDCYSETSEFCSDEYIFQRPPFLYEIRGGFLNIFLSKGWF